MATMDGKHMTKDETIKQLIEDLISAMEYHIEQTRPIHMTTVAIQAAKDALNSMPTAPVQDQIRAITQEAMQKIYDLEDQVRRKVYNIPSAAPVQSAERGEPVGTAGQLFSNTALERLDLRPSTNIYITPPAAQRQWVEVEQIKWEGDKLIAKLKENT